MTKGMTNLEAIELIWERATPKVPGPDPEFEIAHRMVGKLVKNPQVAEIRVVGMIDKVSIKHSPQTPEKTSGE